MVLNQLQVVKARNILVMGDFNFPNIEWEVGHVNGSDESEAAMFFDARVHFYTNMSLIRHDTGKVMLHQDLT